MKIVLYAGIGLAIGLMAAIAFYKMQKNKEIEAVKPKNPDDYQIVGIGTTPPQLITPVTPPTSPDWMQPNFSGAQQYQNLTVNPSLSIAPTK